MRQGQKKEAEQRARLFLVMSIARIIAEITIIIGFFIFIFFIIKKYA
jgi:hypothetical protein